MRTYLVKAGGRKRYASTQADAKATRDELMAQTQSKKKDVSIEEVDISLNKAELLSFINTLCEEGDTGPQE